MGVGPVERDQSWRCDELAGFQGFAASQPRRGWRNLYLLTANVALPEPHFPRVNRHKGWPSVMELLTLS